MEARRQGLALPFFRRVSACRGYAKLSEQRRHVGWERGIEHQGTVVVGMPELEAGGVKRLAIELNRPEHLWTVDITLLAD